jgi:lipoprotein-anchoring transpeptidase ErfK/SrfK
MARSTALVLCSAALAAFGPRSATARPWKPHPIHVIPGVPLKADDIKPYVPPKLGPEPPLEPSEVKTVEITVDEANIAIRPWSSPLLGNAVRGARLPVKGVVKASGHGCSARVWYALEPFGYLCGREGRPTEGAATTESVLRVKEGERLPFHYVMVLVKEGDKVPMWASVEDMKNGAEPERQLEKGDTIAIEKPLKWDGQSYWVSVEGKVMPQKGSSQMGGGSEWHGVAIDDTTPLPFGWITPDKANVYPSPPDRPQKGATETQLQRRTRVNIVEERTVGKKLWLRVTVAEAAPERPVGAIMAEPAKVRGKGEPEQASQPSRGRTPPAPTAEAPAAPTQPTGDLWVSADTVNEVRKLERPKTVGEGIDKWIDVDLGEQVLVTYENDKPVFATLVSSGRAIPTPMGTYPVWAKASAITMKNQPYEDKGYFVNKVPWSTFFQWHNAIHGAYWHDRFGVVKSHGCVNVSPLDARHVFEWVSPPLPPGWTGLRPLELLKSPTVVVRNSHAKKQFRQDRPIGPPDRELEGQRLEEAEKRRADEAAAAGGAPDATGAPAPAPMPSGQAPPAP